MAPVFLDFEAMKPDVPIRGRGMVSGSGGVYPSEGVEEKAPAVMSEPVGSGSAVLGVHAPDAESAAILDFWFGELAPQQWFAVDPAVDRTIVERFSLVAAKIATGGAPQWAESPGGSLAAVIALDQFPRNLYRGDPRAFATDGQALALAEQALDRGFDEGMGVYARQFLYMPFMHSEDAEDQVRALELFEGLGLPEAVEAARRHKEIVDRFGRFPHRNAVLGRETTAEEADFLKEPNSSF